MPVSTNQSDLMSPAGRPCPWPNANRARARTAPPIYALPLTLEPNTVFAARPPQGIPDIDQAWDIQERCQAMLAAAGYAQYEVSAYAQPGRECAHNLNYWRFGDYRGIGAGAHGKLTLGAEQRILRRWKHKHPAVPDPCRQTAAIGGDEDIGPTSGRSSHLNARGWSMGSRGPVRRPHRLPQRRSRRNWRPHANAAGSILTRSRHADRTGPALHQRVIARYLARAVEPPHGLLAGAARPTLITAM